MEKADRDDLEIEGKKAMDTLDSFTPQEVDLSSVQEDSGQQSRSKKEMDESGELDTVQKSSSPKELDEMDEVDISQQVKEDELKEEKDVKDEMRKKMVKEEVPKGETWISWWKKQWKGANNPQAEVHPNQNKASWTEPAKAPDEAANRLDKTCIDENDRQGSRKMGTVGTCSQPI